MDDLAIKTALERFDRLKQEIAAERNKIADAEGRIGKLQGEAAELDRWIAKWYELAGRPLPPTAAERIMKPVDTKKPKRPKNPNRDVVVDKALEIIRERGEPIPRKPLFDALAERGIILQGKDPEMVLSTMLWRSQERIQRLAPFGYWPAGEPYEPVDRIKREIDDRLQLD